MSTHNIGFYEDLTKIIFELSSNIIKYAPHFFLKYCIHHENMSMLLTPPYTPLLYSKPGDYRGIHFFLFLLQNIDCGYSLEPPH